MNQAGKPPPAAHGNAIFYGHSANAQGKWEPLEEHLSLVAEMAADHGRHLPGVEWAELASLWHDLGKYSMQFQNYLRTSADSRTHGGELKGSVDHSSAGAQWALERDSRLGMVLAHLIAGHHAGLLNYAGEAGSACLKHRLSKAIPDWKSDVPEGILKRPMPLLPNLGKPEGPRHAAFRVSFWLRMLFSAIVDADLLATETHTNPATSSRRKDHRASLASMRKVLDDHLICLEKNAEKTSVNRQRASVLAMCRERAQDATGFFDLCVPTGGGKTFASLAFALDHAAIHGLRRVVVAVPFTSIIEQNAQEYRTALKALGPGVVLEHHSNLEPERETDLTRLQSENWDAPLVVTTNVQLFESLFACRTSRCRKLHRLAKSVIVLDEVQALPVELLKPTLWALQELVEVYGCTVVLCSATQPAFGQRTDFPIGLTDVRAIIREPNALYRAMRRTSVTLAGQLKDDALVERLRRLRQVLCIVNTRPHAAHLSEALGDADGHFHLSTRMCAAHRLETLEKIRIHLIKRMTCRVISTQLVEAGVNLDFPVVYRAPCGLDSLAQAAGRCNREGELHCGKVVSFATEKLPPLGHLRQTAHVANEILLDEKDPLAPEAIEAYFRLYYWLREDRWDYHRVLDAAGNNPNTMRFAFRDMASRYRFIPETGHTLIVPWQEPGKRLVEELRQSRSPDRDMWRSLQRYTVQVREHELKQLQDAGIIELLHERWVVASPNHYDARLGLRFGANRHSEDNSP